MKINKLKDRIFCSFASLILNQDVKCYDDDLSILRKDNVIELFVCLGGEIEDEKKFYFSDSQCVLKTFNINAEKQNLSYEWINYILDYTDLTTEEKNEIVNVYNDNVKQEIENYSTQKRELLI